MKLKAIGIRLLNTSQLESGEYDKTLFNQYWTQVSKNASLKEVKKRITDHLSCAGYELKDEDCRLWLYTQNENKDQDIQKRCAQVKAGFIKGPNEEENNEEEQDEDFDPNNLEYNSGVEFPGQSLEPLLNSALRINQLTLNQNSSIIVEYRESDQNKFAFKFRKGEKLIIGVCEWCNSRNILRTVCKCKNVKYCNNDCMEKDKRFHLDKCSAQADGEL